MKYIHIMLPRNMWIYSNISLEVGYLDITLLAHIPYSSLIKGVINSTLIKLDPLTYIIPVGLGYMSNNVFSTKFMIDITCLLSYCDISNLLVKGSIIVTDLRFKFSLFPFLLLMCLSIIYMQSLFRDISLASLADNLPYFHLTVFMLSSVTIMYFFPDNLYNSRPVNFLENNFLLYVYSWIKDISWYQCNM